MSKQTSHGLNVIYDHKSNFHFLIIGSGRLAQHLRHYFNLLNISFSEWDRSQDPHLLSNKIEKSTHVLLAVSDQAIESVYRKHCEGHDKIYVHFSGALHVPGLLCAHPLMTFGHALYEDDFYPRIHFAITGAESLGQILPGLPNSFTVLPTEKKNLYHAMCVLGGNFTTLLLHKMLHEFQSLNIPESAAHLYIGKIIENVFIDPQKALTGPLARKDAVTVHKNLNALEQDPYQQVYQAFVRSQWPEYFKEET